MLLKDKVTPMAFIAFVCRSLFFSWSFNSVEGCMVSAG